MEADGLGWKSALVQLFVLTGHHHHLLCFSLHGEETCIEVTDQCNWGERTVVTAVTSVAATAVNRYNVVLLSSTTTKTQTVPNKRFPPNVPLSHHHYTVILIL